MSAALFSVQQGGEYLHQRKQGKNEHYSDAMHRMQPPICTDSSSLNRMTKNHEDGMFAASLRAKQSVNHENHPIRDIMSEHSRRVFGADGHT